MEIFNWFKQRTLNLGISFNGGGVKATAYIGVIKALEEAGIRPSVVAGLSAGSIIAAGYANGLKSDEMAQIAAGLKLWDVVNRNPIKQQGFISETQLVDFLSDFVKQNDFAALTNPKLLIFATDFDKKQLEVISSGEVISAIVCSCGLPPLISPTIRNGKRLGEGGFSVHYGAKYLRQAGADIVLGLDVGGFDAMKIPGLTGLFEGVTAALKTMSSLEQQLDPVDLELPGITSKGSIIDFSKITVDLIDLGYRETVKIIPELKALLRMQ